MLQLLIWHDVNYTVKKNSCLGTFDIDKLSSLFLAGMSITRTFYGYTAVLKIYVHCVAESSSKKHPLLETIFETP